MTTAYVVCAVVTLMSALVSLGYSVVAFRSATGEAKITASYATARSTALAIVCLVPLFGERELWLFAVASAMIIVQILDMAVGRAQRDQIKTFGPACTAIVNLAALIWAILAGGGF